MESDNLDQFAAEAFEGLIERKNLQKQLPNVHIDVAGIHNSMDILYKGREYFTLDEWKDFLIRSVGLESTELTEKAKNVLFVRMIPFLECNYNMIELGPRGTGKSFLYQQNSNFSHLVSGGKVPVSKMFYNQATRKPGILCKYDVICIDEVSDFSFDQEDGINLMKDYMENGQFSRSKDSISADGSIAITGNLQSDIEHQQEIKHLFNSLPYNLRNDIAFMDRIHAYVPGWEFPRLSKVHMTSHFGLVNDFLAECWSQLRQTNRLSSVSPLINYGDALNFRDTKAVNKTLNGLLKLMQPNPEVPITNELLEWALKVSLEYRRRVKEQQKTISPNDFGNTNFSYRLGENGIETYVPTPEMQSENAVADDQSKYKDITDKFISAAMQVHKVHGSGFTEGHYIYLLQKEGNLSFSYLRDVLMPIYKGDTKIGTQRLHFFIEDTVAVELKVIPKLEEVHFAEAIRNLEAFNIEVGLLVNFGSENFEFKRLVNTKFKG